MKVAFIYDAGNEDGSRGGAELTMDEFVASAPEDVKIVAPDKADVVVIGNCVGVPREITATIKGRVIRYHNDLARHEHPELRRWLEHNARHIFTSPLHRDRYGLDGDLIPPAIDLKRFKPRRPVTRSGTVCVGAFMNPGKGAHLLSKWIDANGPVDFYGFGQCVPHNVTHMGPVEQKQLPQTLHRYERFVFLPSDPEPFGRCVVEAHAAGCEVITNRLVGARYWLEEAPEKLASAAKDFWSLVRDG